MNWLLHTAAACALFAFARDFLRGKAAEGTALFAALLFAVHPLCSEIPNYARCQDLAWVTLFSLLACWAVLGFLQGGGFWLLGPAIAAFYGATASKGPGFFHAAMMVGMVVVVSLTPEHRRNARRWAPWAGGALVLGIAALWLVGLLPRWWSYAQANWGEPRFIGHAYTLARVFWEFAWRAVIPVKLCSDHQIAETLVKPGDGWFGIADSGAMWAAGLRPDQDAMAMRDHMYERGGVVCRALNADSLLFCPPLVTTDAQIDRIVDAVASAAQPAG